MLNKSKTWEALGLLNSMVEGGECHSDQSRQCVASGRAALETLEEQVKRLRGWIKVNGHGSFCTSRVSVDLPQDLPHSCDCGYEKIIQGSSHRE